MGRVAGFSLSLTKAERKRISDFFKKEGVSGGWKGNKTAKKKNNRLQMYTNVL